MKEVHLLCNAHIDPIWQWDWQEGVSAVLSTFQSAVNLAGEFDYVFCHNEVTVYKYVEEYDPALFQRIRELIRQGKWHVTGGWYLQPDCNMPSGESFVRQIREGQRYFKEKFGVTPKTAVNFDPFGHSVGLVQIIKKCGQGNYIFMRPYPGEMKLPEEQFIWQGLDGSEIKACRVESYNTPLGESAGKIVRRAARQPQDVVCVPWGVGNHGGGPSRKDLSDIKELLSDKETHYLHSTPDAFFDKINPVHRVNTSLRISMPGCYTSMGRVKRKHARLENELWMTEKMLTVAKAKGLLKDYPEDMIHTVTEDLLNAEFHDVLPGTCIQCGEENGLKLLDHGLLEVERLKTKAYFALAAAEKPAAEGEYPLVIFNPHPYPLTENVECEFMLADQNWSDELASAMTVCNEKGRVIPYQIVKEESNLNLDWRKRIVFEAELAPLSMNRFSVYIKFEPKKEKTTAQNLVFDNGRKRVEIDGKTGLLKDYTVNGVNYVKNGFELVMMDDNADPWAMGKEQLSRLGENEQPFRLSEKPCGVFEGMRSVQVIEDGDIYLGIEAFFEKNNTRARIGYKIYKNNDFVDVDVTVFMGDINKIVKLKVPFSVAGTPVTQTAFGVEPIFTDGRENASQRFVALAADGPCPVLINDSVYGNHFENNTLYSSLVRGVTYCAHPIADRRLIPTDRFVKKIDQGENSFSFRLGVMQQGEMERRTQEFLQKPYGFNIFPTAATAEPLPFTLTLEDTTVALITAKKKDGSDALLFRLLNNTADTVDTAVSVNDGVRLALHFGKFEVKTVLFENGTLTECPELLI